MKKIIIISLILGVFFTCAGWDFSSMSKKGSEAKILSILKRFQICSNLYQMEQGRYGKLQELYEWDKREMGEELYRAWDGHNNPQPLGGYLFTNIDRDASGAALDLREQIGLCAYPAEPEKTGDYIFCMLADLRDPDEIDGSIEQNSFISHGQEWTLYKARYEDIKGPVRRWPTKSELKTKFHAREKLTPEEGLEKARDIYKRAQDEIRQE